MITTIYTNKIFQRMSAVPNNAEDKRPLPNESALTELEADAKLLSHNQLNALKPIKRSKDKNIPLSLYNIGGVPSVKAMKLGAGVYARTYLHVDGLPLQPGETQADHTYAVKVFKSRKGRHQADIAAELAVLKALGRLIRYDSRDVMLKTERKDPHDAEKTVTRHEAYTKTYMVQTFIPGQNLCAYLKGITSECYLLSKAQAVSLMQNICHAVLDLHKKGFTHGDMNDTNVMITPDKQAVLIDFNFSRPIGQLYFFGYRSLDEPGIEIPPANSDVKLDHLAPECFNVANIQFTTASDVYAMGYLFQKILDATSRTTRAHAAFASLIQDMRAHNPSKRPLVSDILKALKKIQPGPVRRSSNVTPLAPVMKTAVITALENYEYSINSYLSAIVDSSRAKKSELIAALTQKLQAHTQLAPFVETLKAGFKHYIREVILPDLGHYAGLDDLGRGLTCFIDAIKACGIEIDVQSLIDEVGNTLPQTTDGIRLRGKLVKSLSPPESSIRSTQQPQRVRCV